MEDQLTLRKRAYSLAYAEKNRLSIRIKNRAHYAENKDVILKKRRTKRVHCELCNFSFCNRLYLRKHLLCRHKLNESEASNIAQNAQMLEVSREE